MKNREKTAKRDENGLFEEGTVPGPGRPKGQRNYATIYREALIKLAEQEGMSADELENEILMKGLRFAKKGDYRFYKDLNDRLHGKPMQRTDVTSDGKPVNFVINSEIADKNGITPSPENNSS